MGEAQAGNWPETARRMRRRAPQPVGRHSNRYEGATSLQTNVGRGKKSLLKAATFRLVSPTSDFRTGSDCMSVIKSVCDVGESEQEQNNSVQVEVPEPGGGVQKKNYHSLLKLLQNLGFKHSQVLLSKFQSNNWGKWVLRKLKRVTESWCSFIFRVGRTDKHTHKLIRLHQTENSVCVCLEGGWLMTHRNI